MQFLFDPADIIEGCNFLFDPSIVIDRFGFGYSYIYLKFSSYLDFNMSSTFVIPNKSE